MAVTIVKDTYTPITLLQSKMNDVLDDSVKEGINTAETVTYIINGKNKGKTLDEIAAQYGVIIIGGENSEKDNIEQRVDLLGELGYKPVNER